VRTRVLLIHGGHAGGRTERLVQAVAAGVREAAEGADEGDDGVELRVLPALQAGIDDLLWCRGLLIATPEHFGYMSGAVKDFFDRTFYPAEGRTEGLPYALCVSAGNDGTGTIRAVERIATGYRWKPIAEPVLVVGPPEERHLAACRELGQTMAAGLAAGLY
jgi:multimeric flavodoxin WrbA